MTKIYICSQTDPWDFRVIQGSQGSKTQMWSNQNTLLTKVSVVIPRELHIFNLPFSRILYSIPTLTFLSFLRYSIWFFIQRTWLNNFKLSKTFKEAFFCIIKSLFFKKIFPKWELHLLQSFVSIVNRKNALCAKIMNWSSFWPKGGHLKEGKNDCNSARYTIMPLWYSSCLRQVWFPALAVPLWVGQSREASKSRQLTRPVGRE